jgi:hypothetical protein
MKLVSTAAVAAALFGGVLAVSAPASAITADPGLKAPSATEPVACRTVRERIRRPNGAVVWRERRVCTPGFAMHPRPACVTERQRIVRPNGAVVFKTVRRCR